MLLARVRSLARLVLLDRKFPAGPFIYRTVGACWRWLSRLVKRVRVSTEKGPGNETAAADIEEAKRLITSLRLSDAEHVLNRILAGDPNQADAHYHLGRLSFARGEYQAAVTSLDKAAAIDRTPERVYSLAEALLWKGAVDQAREILRGACSEWPSAAHRLFFGDVLLEQGEEQRAANTYLKAIQLYPDLARDYSEGQSVSARPPEHVLAQLSLIDAYNRVGDSLLCRGHGFEMLPFYLRAKQLQKKALEIYPPESGIRDNYRDSRVLPPFWCLRISHIAFLDFYIKFMELGWASKKNIYLLAPPEVVSNSAYLQQWRKHVEIITDRELIGQLMPLTKLVGDTFSSSFEMPDGKVRWWIDAAGLAQETWEKENRSPLLRVDPDLKARGTEVLSKLGLPDQAWYVCLHVRESGFYGEGDHPAYTFRNGSIENFQAAINEIVKRGGWVIRVGDPSMTARPSQNHVIDYAHSRFKSDWMDVFLCASCKFFIGSTSGLYLVPATFGVPCVLVDWASYCPRPWFGNHIFVPKRYFSSQRKQFLKFSDIFSEDFRWKVYDGRALVLDEIDVLDSEEEDIAQAVVEMLSKLDGKNTLSANDMMLVDRFDDLCRTYHVIGKSKISTNFLRKHQELLS